MSDLKIRKWDIQHLQLHLQAAVDLEFWTIPFYLSAMYSLKDPSSEIYQLIQSVAYQEMLHVELASNLANAYGLSPTFNAPQYQGQTVPHLDFDLDTPNPTETYHPYSAEIGPLDLARVNTMCLVEYPEWKTGHRVDIRETVSEYGSIGEFYDAVEVGAAELVGDLVGGRRQVNQFQNFYRNFDQQTVIGDGATGLAQAANIITAIRSQGEGGNERPRDIPEAYRNTADDVAPAWQHYKKFITIRHALLEGKQPETYCGVADPAPGSPGFVAQQILIANFTEFRLALEALFRGDTPPNFGAIMATLGGNILNCWKNGAIPKFS